LGAKTFGATTFGATLRGAMGAGFAMGFGAFTLVAPNGGAGRSALNSSAIFGMSLEPIPKRSRQLRFSVTGPFDEFWSMYNRFASHLLGGPYAENSKAMT
jgi:hypothetical protein